MLFQFFKHYLIMLYIYFNRKKKKSSKLFWWNFNIQINQYFSGYKSTTVWCYEKEKKVILNVILPVYPLDIIKTYLYSRGCGMASRIRKSYLGWKWEIVGGASNVINTILLMKSVTLNYTICSVKIIIIKS